MSQGSSFACRSRTKAYWLPLSRSVFAIASPSLQSLEKARRIEDLIDELVVADGADDTRFVTTTSHSHETVEEVVEFAGFWNDERDQPVQIVSL